MDGCTLEGRAWKAGSIEDLYGNYKVWGNVSNRQFSVNTNSTKSSWLRRHKIKVLK